MVLARLLDESGVILGDEAVYVVGEAVDDE
jgi:hypothetical protein